MFRYVAALLAGLRTSAKSVTDVLQQMKTIESVCDDGDGLKWFNLLYLQVTQAVAAQISSGGITDAAWLAELDVQFARLYFGALQASLAEQPVPGCWEVLWEQRNRTAIARIQFALAGINAHINHDLPQAIVTTCEVTVTEPEHGGTHYNDYTSLNATLDGLIESAKQTLHVRLLGDALPLISHLDETIAAWSVSAARETAWRNAELLWHLRDLPDLSSTFMESLDGLTALAGQALLVPVP